MTPVLYNVLFLERTDAKVVGLSISHSFRHTIAHGVSNGLISSLVCIGTERMFPGAVDKEYSPQDPESALGGAFLPAQVSDISIG